MQEDMQCTGLYSTSGILVCEYQSSITETFHLKVARKNKFGLYVAILRTLSKRAVVLQGDENIIGRLQLKNKAGLTTQPEFNISEY